MVKIEDEKIFLKISHYKDVIRELKEKIDFIYTNLDQIENREKATNSNELFKLENDSVIFKEVLKCLIMALNNQPCTFSFPIQNDETKILENQEI